MPGLTEDVVPRAPHLRRTHRLDAVPFRPPQGSRYHALAHRHYGAAAFQTLDEAWQIGRGIHVEQHMHVIGHQAARDHVAPLLSGDRRQVAPKEARGPRGDRALPGAGGPDEMDVEAMAHADSVRASRPILGTNSSRWCGGRTRRERSAPLQRQSVGRAGAFGRRPPRSAEPQAGPRRATRGDVSAGARRGPRLKPWPWPPTPAKRGAASRPTTRHEGGR
jgi:hypothetical protein